MAMANRSHHLLSLSFCFLLLVNGGLGQLEQAQQRIWQRLQGQQQHILAGRPSCNIQRITAQEPSIRIPSEAGLTEVWDSNTPEFECAVVEVERKTIEPNGLLLPHYSNAAKLYYVIQGRAIHGTVVPGCAETFESPVTVRGQGQGHGQSQSFVDRHQRLVRVTQGDVVAVAAGFTHWIYNDGNTPFVAVGLADLANGANQLDLQYRNFFLAGNSQQQQGQEQGQQGQWQPGQQQGQGQGQQGQWQPGQQGQQGQGQRQPGQQQGQGQGQQGQWQPGQQGQQGQGQRQPGQQGQGQGQGQQGQGQRGGNVGVFQNIFKDFEDEFLATIFRIPRDLASKLKGQNNRRGSIVRAERLQLSLPEFDQEEQRERQQQQQQPGQQQGQQGQGQGLSRNGLEETECSVKIRENIANPARADLYNPRAGRLSTINSQTLPILDVLGLSAEHANLYSNAIFAPRWTINAHSVLYVLRGSARIQVVGANGNSVFDEEVNQGQLIVVPQNFVVVKKAGDQGFEYIAFKTNDNAMTSSLAGRLSAFRAIPVDILVNSFRISQKQARELKYGREESEVLSGSQSQSQGRIAVA